ncbi:MAG TPA: arginase family protein [Candidatus Dormibacteraeota bacterium]
MIFVPHFIGERSRDGARLADGDLVAPPLPEAAPQRRLAVLYEELAARVAASARPRVQAGDCVATLGVVAGLQRRGIDFHLVWLDAHGDFNTWETTPSGFLGGMPLAMLAGLGEQTIVEALGVRTLPADRILLVGARDLDPGERENLSHASIPQADVGDVLALAPAGGPLYVHLDLDVVATDEMPAVNYPAPDGPTAAAVRRALDHLFATGRVAALSVTCWDPALDGAERSRATAAALVGDLLS